MHANSYHGPCCRNSTDRYRYYIVWSTVKNNEEQAATKEGRAACNRSRSKTETYMRIVGSNPNTFVVDMTALPSGVLMNGDAWKHFGHQSIGCGGGQKLR